MKKKARTEVTEVILARSHNYVYTDYVDVEATWNNDEIKYDIWQQECCPTTKKLHRQGYFQLKYARDIQWLKKNICPTTHFEIARGTYEQNVEYCTKIRTSTGKIWAEWGEPTQQGSRSDLRDIYEEIKQGEAMINILERHPGSFIRYHKAFDRIKAMLMPKRTTEPIVTLLWGEAGAGKTRFVFDKHGIDKVYKKSDSSKWFDGYMQEEAFLLDDYDWDFKRGFLLNLFDRYPMKVEIKGGMVEFNSPYLYITCNHLPNLDDALTRRFHHIIEMKNGDSKSDV